MATVDAVIDLGFGDSGKGKTVDWLCSQQSSFKKTIVIRFSGGQQAGHTVVLDSGKSHIHASFPSGTLRGFDGYLSEHCCVYLPDLKREHEVLSSKLDQLPLLFIHPQAILTTPFDLIYGRLREEKHRHGSCGMGIGATMKRHHETPYKIHAIDLTSKWILEEKLKVIRSYYLEKFREESLDLEESLLDHFMLDFRSSLEGGIPSNVVFSGYSTLSNYSHLIFEGSQGVLLDKDFGIFPHVTYANTTVKNIKDILEGIYVSLFDVHYVTRGYSWRHGNGPLRDEDESYIQIGEEETNKFNAWQGSPRVGPLCEETLQYAIDLNRSFYSGSFFPGREILHINCLDQLSEDQIDRLISLSSSLKIKNDLGILLSNTPKSYFFTSIKDCNLEDAKI